MTFIKLVPGLRKRARGQALTANSTITTRISKLCGRHRVVVRASGLTKHRSVG